MAAVEVPRRRTATTKVISRESSVGLCPWRQPPRRPGFTGCDLASAEADNLADALRHIDHVALHGADAELLEQVDVLRADLEAGRLDDAERKVLELLGPAAEGEFDAISAHLGMALAANDRGEPEDVTFHLISAVDAAAGHDHEELLQGLLDDWVNDTNRHGVIDALYEAVSLEHPPH